MALILMTGSTNNTTEYVDLQPVEKFATLLSNCVSNKTYFDSLEELTQIAEELSRKQLLALVNSLTYLYLRTAKGEEAERKKNTMISRLTYAAKLIKILQEDTSKDLSELIEHIETNTKNQENKNDKTK